MSFFFGQAGLAEHGAAVLARGPGAAAASDGTIKAKTIGYWVTAAVLVLKGKEQITSATPVAEQTVETLKEDVEWARQQRT